MVWLSFARIANVGTGAYRLNHWRWLRTLVVALGLTVVVNAGASASAPQPSPLIPGTESVAGRSYGQWVVADWR